MVFIEYERLTDGSVKPLQFKHLDTGMGFERLAMVLQGKQSTYETDVFEEIYSALETITGVSPNTNTDTIVAYRVISDHIRSIIYSLNDDIVPFYEGRGAIIQKLFNRAYQYGCQYLNPRSTFMSELMEMLMPMFIASESSIEPKRNLILYIIREEELKISNIMIKTVSSFKMIIDRKDSKIILDDIVLLKSRGLALDTVIQFAKDHSYEITCDLEQFLNPTDAKEAKRNAKAERRKERKNVIYLNE